MTRSGRHLATWAFFLVLGAGWLFAADPHVRLSQYGHSVWRLQDGVLGSAPTVIAQSNDGYIWIGTETGLLRFDGAQFAPFSPPGWEQVFNPEVTALFSAKDGTLWIGTTSKIASWKDGKLTVIDPRGYTNAFAEDHQARIWAAVSRSKEHKPVCQLSSAKAECFGAANGIPFNFGGGLDVDSDGNLIVSSASNVIHWSRERGLVSSYVFDSLKRNEGLHGISALLTEANGLLLVGIGFAGKGLGLVHLKDGIVSTFLEGGIDGSYIAPQTLFRDGSGCLWIGTVSDGLYRMCGAAAEHFTTKDGLSGDSVRDFKEDREGNIWVSTDNGVDCFHDLKVISWSSREGFPSGFVSSVLAGRSGSIFIGSHDALYVLRDGKISIFDAAHGLPGNGVTALQEDALGQQWMGVSNELVVFDGRHFKEIKRADGKPAGVVTSLALGADKSIWACVLGNPGTLLHVTNGKAESVQALSSPVCRVVQDKDSGVWFSDRERVGHYSRGKTDWISLPLKPQPTTSPITALLAGPDGAIFASSRDGVWALRDGELRSLGIGNGLPCQDANGMGFSAQGALLLRSSCGLIRIAPEILEAWRANSEQRVSYQLIDSYDGVRLSHATFSPQMSLGLDGRMWLANGSGVQVLDADHIPINPMPPPVHIQEILVDHVRQDAIAGLRLGPLIHEIEIRYAGLSFSEPQKVHFRYMLEGRDTTWQDPGVRRSAFYQDLKPGRYRFRVLAANNDGVWNSAGDTLDFSVRPAWFQTIWCRVLCMVVVCLLIWMTYRIRINSIAKAIGARFDERLDERTRMALELHDTFLQTVQGSKMVADDALDPDADQVRMRHALERLSVWLGQAVTEGRAALHALRVSTTEQNHLAEFLDRTAREYAQRTSISVALSVIGDARDLHPIVRDEIARIAEEAIRNSCLHSKASQLSIELRYGRDLILRFNDNGVGIDPDVMDVGKQGHFGIQGMKERSARIRARITITSTLNAGTQIILNVPGDAIYRREKKSRFSALRILKLWPRPLNGQRPNADRQSNSDDE